MQTFLPYTDFTKSARVLDSKRLNKQIVEAYQLLTSKLSNLNHPAYLMWEHSKNTLKDYTLEFCKEYTLRFNRTHKVYENIIDLEFSDESLCFLNDPKYDIDLFTLTHRVNLVRKDPDFYGCKFKELLADIDKYPKGYYWPICKGFTSILDTNNWLKFKSNTNYLI